MRLAEKPQVLGFRALCCDWPARILVLLVLVSAISTQVGAQPTSVLDDKAMDRAAEEYVAQKMPMDDARRARARRGQVLPPCQIDYPDIGSAPSPDFANRMYHAVIYAVTKQNMIAAGLTESLAFSYADSYRRELLEYEALPASEQHALEQNHNSPRWRLPGYLNGIIAVPGLPHFVGPEQCTIFLNATIATPYRFVLVPSSGRFWVIPSFSFRYCQLRFANPYSRSQCKEWEEVLEGEDRTFLGKYLYSAEWAGRPPRRGPLNLTYTGTGVRRIVVRRPSH